MGSTRNNWITEKEEAYLDNRDQIDSRHQATYKDRITEKANGPFIHLLHHIPELARFITPSSIERIQNRIDPFQVGRGLARLFTREQLLHMAAAFAWEDQEPEESDQEFLHRVPGLIEDFSNDLQETAGNARVNIGFASFVQRINEKILNVFETEIKRKRDETNVDMGVPAHRVAHWVVSKETLPDAPILSQLLTLLYSSDHDHREKVQQGRLLLRQASETMDITTPRSGDEQWALHLPPTETDLEQYTASIEGLYNEVEAVIEMYWEDQNIVDRDKLLTKALDTADELTQKDRQILDRESRSNTHEDWTRYDTRRANALTDTLRPPLLTREESQNNRKEWELTTFGKFVNWLRDEKTQKEIERDVFPAEAPTELVETAITPLRSNPEE